MSEEWRRIATTINELSDFELRLILRNGRQCVQPEGFVFPLTHGNSPILVHAKNLAVKIDGAAVMRISPLVPGNQARHEWSLSVLDRVKSAGC